MTNRYTQEEWRGIIKQAERDLPSEHVQYEAVKLGSADFPKTIDHTLLKVDATKEQIDSLCNEARQHDFKARCWALVGLVLEIAESNPSLEARDAVAAGASELDMVLNYDQLKQGDLSSVYTELAAVRHAAPRPVVLKVILETSQLSHADIIAGCKIAEAAQFDFVKTSTGFKGGGATKEHVRLMREVVGDKMKVKASGGVKTVEDCIGMMEAGASRIGTSNGVWIMEEAKTLIDQLTHEAGGNGAGRRPSVQTTRLFSDS